MLNFIGGIGALAVSLVLGAVFIPMLRRLKFGQEIREEGPAWHAAKSGTPTMGGIIFIASIAIMLIISVAAGTVLKLPLGNLIDLLLVFLLSLAFGVIGFIDDYIKVVKKRNLGLTAAQKFSLQFLVALVFATLVAVGGGTGTVIDLPFTDIDLDLGWFYIPFVIFVMLATVNSVNLTDGLDGLATSITIVVALYYLIMSNILSNPAMLLFSSTVVGALAGFLFYNHKPAKVFMGDTGSLFLGGAVCGLAIMLRQPLTLLIVGLVYVVETLSVIMQVTSYKLTGKRIFKMSPIHHHFEMCGWSEVKIVCVFTAVTAVLCALMLYFK
ncbi:MAG: phospho-N-acetylmuramoyl-pentapeptide-transferase [Clostridiales bacterium]|nr:phospho-N-acetylmuramoyl-pentapeptide-transferase [Clostridiales bacterium]